MGREMISEILPISEHLSSLIAKNASKETLKEVALEEGFIDLYRDGMIRAANGKTSYEEILRVAKLS
jgi:general secretion pathway protein E